MVKRKAPVRAKGAGHCGCKKKPDMKGGRRKKKRRGFWSRVGNTVKKGVNVVRSGIKQVNKIPGVKYVRQGLDTVLSSPLMPEVVNEAYNSADKSFRAVNELSKGNFKEAGKEFVSSSPVTTFIADKAFGSGATRNKRSANTRVRRVAASSSRVNAPVMMRRR
jgi:hypothetical protein